MYSLIHLNVKPIKLTTAGGMLELIEYFVMKLDGCPLLLMNGHIYFQLMNLISYH